MDNRKETPISEMDDQALQIHALGVAYREAERRREEAEKRREEAEKQCEKRRLEIRDLEGQLMQMTQVYQTLMAKNAELTSALRKLQAEAESRQKGGEEKQADTEPQERGQES
jgi:chromosome segregation ATPase